MKKTIHPTGYIKLIKSKSINLHNINIIIMKTSVLLFTMGGVEWLLIALVILLLFGGKKIPELMRGLGKGITEFKKGKEDTDTKKE